MMTKEELIAFENDIAECFTNKMIKAPIHLEHDNEEHLIEVFKYVKKEDWVLGSWRQHYKCLLKGVPPEKLKEAILAGKSISLSFKDYNILSSAIVTGPLPIALGIAFDIKNKKGAEKVWCFLGDMTSCSGIFHECYNYAKNWNLPIVYVIEDNGKSVCTDTRKTWNCETLPYEQETDFLYKSSHLWYYKYNLSSKYPHSGPGGRRIQF